ncbi:NACHT, LRR and PYD domains-containing protein 3-like [Hoplias malabaricus]|uniref:NACHT, LRR and PYD domains-containing protein 3-like n=1 Tax=Hoplias malabaricus TaxID=27720 RepID=UPI0034618091
MNPDSSKMSSPDEDTKKEERLAQGQRSDSPEPSHVSMRSEQSMGQPIIFKMEECSTEPSHVSMRSEQSMGQPIIFKMEDCSTEPRLVQGQRSDSSEASNVSMRSDQSMGQPIIFSEEKCSAELSCVSTKSDPSKEQPATFRNEDNSKELKVQKSPDIGIKNMDSIFKNLEQKAISILKKQLKKFVQLLTVDDPECSEKEVEEKEDQRSVRDGALKITLHALMTINQTHLANKLQSKLAPFSHLKHKSSLREHFQKINEGISKSGASVLLNKIYTELYITEGGTGEVNKEHEVRQIQTASRKPATGERPISYNDIFEDKSIKTVLTKGVAGIGKTVSVQKFILDWAEGKANQDVLFVFPLPFRELNLMTNQKLSLTALVHLFFRDTFELKPEDFYNYKIMFIFDGLDECRLPLDFQNNERLGDVTQLASVDVLLTNIIKGDLLPSALLWITTRPAAASQIPPDCINQVTEVRGFNDPQKEEYFRKKISDPHLAERIITHIKSSRSLHIMCHIPVFCWIAASVLERILGEAGADDIPKTLTQMCKHFLIFQIKNRKQKYQEKHDIDNDQTRKFVLALGKLAFEQLEKGNLIFYDTDLKECDIDVKDVSVYSGVCTQIFIEESGLRQDNVFSFVHLSIQEFLAALYAYMCFILNNRNVLLPNKTRFFALLWKSTMSDFLKSAVDKALQCENGHLDLFLRFLMGLSLKSNQTLLRGLLTQRGHSHSKEEIVQYIKEKIKKNPSPEKTINLFYCLHELNDHSLIEEVQKYLKRRGGPSGAPLSSYQWSAVAFLILNSEEELDDFDLRKYHPSEECLQRLMPVIKACKKVLLRKCNLTEKSCEVLASVLSSSTSVLRELHLNENKLQDSGVKQLSAGLSNHHCKLKKLGLENCSFGEEGCAVLVSSLKSNPSHLQELNINSNATGNSSVNLLCSLLEDPDCKLEKIQLRNCNLTEKSCGALASVISSSFSVLKELNLSENKLQDSGVKLLSVGLKNQHCKLEKLGLINCDITEEGCATLVSVLKSNSSKLKELNVKHNKLGDSGVKLLSDLLEDPSCELQKLHI